MLEKYPEKRLPARMEAGPGPIFLLGRRLIQTARWLLLAALVYAPMAFGCTRPEFKLVLSNILLVILVIFLSGCLAARRLPRLAGISGAASLLILAYGWFLTLNARQEFDPDLCRFFDRIPVFPLLPGAIDEATAFSHMLLFTGLIGAFWIAGDMAANERWRNRLWLIICLTGLAALSGGLAARLTGFDAKLFEGGAYVFWPYRYHANAGAFINLVLPFLAYRAAAVFVLGGSSWAKASWCLAALVVTACGFVNASKAAMVITGILTTLFGAERIFATVSRRPRAFKIALSAAAILGSVAALGWAFGIDRAWMRWQALPDQLSADNARLLVYQAIWKEALPVSGWWGFGPGTFQISFPFFCHDAGPSIKGIWRYAHEDYLQTILEWGWIGAALWAVLIFGALFRGPWIRPAVGVSCHRLFPRAATLALVGICLHSLVDFPFQIASLQLYAAVAAGILWASSSRRLCNSKI